MDGNPAAGASSIAEALDEALRLALRAIGTKCASSP